MEDLTDAKWTDSDFTQIHFDNMKILSQGRIENRFFIWNNSKLCFFAPIRTETYADCISYIQEVRGVLVPLLTYSLSCPLICFLCTTIKKHKAVLGADLLFILAILYWLPGRNQMSALLSDKCNFPLQCVPIKVVPLWSLCSSGLGLACEEWEGQSKPLPFTFHTCKVQPKANRTCQTKKVQILAAVLMNSWDVVKAVNLFAALETTMKHWFCF